MTRTQALLIAHGFREEQVLHPELVLGPRSGRIRRALRKGPSTANELAALLQIDRRSVAIGVNVLVGQGHIAAVGRVELPEGPRTIYGLTERGRRALRNQVRSTGEPKAAAGPPPHTPGPANATANAVVFGVTGTGAD